MRSNLTIAAGAVLAFAGCNPDTSSVSLGVEGGPKVAPTLVQGNPSCSDLFPGSFERKIEPVADGVYGIPGTAETIEISTDGVLLAFESTIGIDAVIMKGGAAANVYEYDPEEKADSDLVSPDNASGDPAAISHVSFCFDFEVEVEKTANARFTRTYTWEITKEGDESQLLMRPGQHHEVSYSVTLSETHEDSAHAVSGEITVRNPAPATATIESVTDTFLGQEIAVDCGVSFPHDLAPGENLTCTYDAAVAGPVSGENLAVVETSGVVGGGDATAAVDFDSADIEAVDACVDVDDSLVGLLGTVCAGEAPETFEYSYTISVTPADCEGLLVDNVASFVAADSGAAGSDSHGVEVEVECEQSCTLTQGYWKTHSSYGPAKKTDETWDLLGGPDAPFFLSGQSYYQVLWTPPRGNTYYNLAHQYIAAELNVLAGASLGDAADAFAAATAVLEAYTPAQIGSLKGKSATELRSKILALASILDEYNNGLIGPGHCSEK
jgi:hypothetical protein